MSIVSWEAAVDALKYDLCSAANCNQLGFGEYICKFKISCNV